MIGAHLDSVENGPGIVDNGSGVASLLEIATQLGAKPSVHNIVRFAFFGDEESGAVGSTAYVEIKTGVTNPECIEFVGDDEAPFVEAGIPVGGAENGDADDKTSKQAKAWGGQAGEPYDRCYHGACDTINNVNRDVLNHYTRALAGTLAHFAASTDELR
jgi:aminopeptidase S